MTNAHNRITAARVSLLLDPKFSSWGALAMRLKVKADPTCKTAWVDGRTLGYNPAFIDTLNHDECFALVAHEVWHVVCGHCWRRGGREMKKWNIACDKAANTPLRDAGLTLPQGAYYAEGDEVGKSAECEEQEETEDTEEPEGEQGGDAGDEDGESDEEGGESDGSGNGEGDSEGGEGEGDPQGEVRDAPTGPDEDGDEAPSEQEWKEAVATAAALANSQGQLPGSMARAIADALKPRVDIRSLVLRWMQERTASDYSWTRPNVRYMAQGTYLPALYSHRMGEVAVMVDTSGSIDDVALDSARQIVQSVLDECDPAGVTLYMADAQVCGITRLERGELLTWEPKGGGGTDFRPALEAIEQDESQPVCCICITDLEGTFPTVAPEVPVLWLATKELDWYGKPLAAPFGETVYIGE
jgi:predicted metal-dependent peptidase